MLDTVISYAPKPIEEFPWMARSRLIAGNPLAWNLAWASYENMAVPHPDHQFTVAVYHTANLLLSTGVVDLGGTAPDNVTVRGRLKLPPPAFLRWLRGYPHIAALPLMQRYGLPWFNTVDRRCKSWTDHTVRVPVHAPDPITEATYRDLLARL